MTSKDPKDMTASELVRWVENYTDIMCRACREMGFGCDDAEVSDCEKALEFIADKIDAELAQARKESLRRGAELWAKANGWPDFRDGEDFGAWLDRCALPRPRFEDGEPVQMGDEIAICGGDIDVNEVVMLLDGSGYRLLHSTDVSASAIEDRVKRPAPEALGADGLPIVVGETVYPIDSEWLDTTLEVLSVESLSVKVSLPSGKGWTMFRADRLTHTPPDTQESIDADKGKKGTEYWRCVGFLCGDCPAEIDGKRPSDRYGVLNCSIARGMDIARRQADLDARKGGE